MLTYKSLEIIGNNDGSQQNINTILHLRIENLQKSVACHRAAVDFDKGFILQSVKMVAGFDVKHDHQPWPSWLLCVKMIQFPAAVPPQLLAPTVDSDETERGERHPWFWDEEAPIKLGVAAP